jgi:hypothetical protein
LNGFEGFNIFITIRSTSLGQTLGTTPNVVQSIQDAVSVTSNVAALVSQPALPFIALPLWFIP